MPIAFITTKEDDELIFKIAQRAEDEIFKKYNINQLPIHTAEDLYMCHSYGCYLDLQKLFNLPEFDFANDIIGISSNLNRETGEIDNFLPKSAYKM